MRGAFFWIGGDVGFEGFLFNDDSFKDFFEVDDLELVDFG